MALGDKSSPLSDYFSPVSARDLKRRRRNMRILVGVAAIAAIPALNATFASSITLSNSSFEFGQGAASASVCDSSITVAVNNVFDSDLSYFKATTITLGDMNTTAGGCLGKTLTVRAFTAAGAELDLNDAAAGTSLTYSVSSNSGTSASQDLTVAATLDSASIAKVTIETS